MPAWGLAIKLGETDRGWPATASAGDSSCQRRAHAYPYLLETLITDLTSQGYRVKRLPPGSPDEDLARAARYAHFIPTSRGFSALMALMAFLSGRRVHVFSDAPGKSMEEAILCLL